MSRKSNPIVVGSLWAFAVLFALVGGVALIAAANRPEVPAAVEVSVLESNGGTNREYREIGRHLALYQAAALRLGSGDPANAGTRVRSAVVPIVSESNPLMVELREIGETHGGVENIPAGELPSLDAVRVFVRTRRYRKVGELPTNGRWQDALVGQVRTGERALLSSEMDLFAARFPGRGLDGWVVVQAGDGSEGTTVAATFLAIGLLLGSTAWRKGRRRSESGAMMRTAAPEVPTPQPAARSRLATHTVASEPRPHTVAPEPRPATPRLPMQSQPIPAALYGELPPGTESLGGFLRTYPPSPNGLIRAFVMLAVFTGLAVVCAYMPHSKPPQPGEEGLIFAMFYGAAAVCALMGLGILITTALGSGKTFHLFETGLVEIAGKRRRAVPFTRIRGSREIEEFQLLTLHHIHMYWFELGAGQADIAIDIESTRDGAELGDFVQMRV